MIGTRSVWRIQAPAAEGREQVRASVESVMDALLDIEAAPGSRINSPAVSLDLGTMSVEIDLAADVDDIDLAAKLVDEAIRQALNSIGHKVLDLPMPVEKHARVLAKA
jgi:hypothetical protein